MRKEIFLSKKYMQLTKYRHNRDLSLDQSLTEFCSILDKEFDNPKLDEWYSWYKEYFDLPKDVLRHFVKNHAASDYDFVRKCRFNKNFYISRIFIGIARYLFFLFRKLIVNKNKKSKSMEIDLIIDRIEGQDQSERYKKLIKMFGYDKTLIIGVPKYDNFGISLREFGILFKAIWKHFIISVNIRINLFFLNFYILNFYFYYRKLFQEVRAKYIINHHHYHTNAIKNYLFKKMGGLKSTTIQKNIYHWGVNGFYYEADIVFALGKDSISRAFSLGAKIDQVVPVGCFFMEHYVAELNIDTSDTIREWDVVIFGGERALSWFVV